MFVQLLSSLLKFLRKHYQLTLCIQKFNFQRNEQNCEFEFSCQKLKKKWDIDFWTWICTLKIVNCLQKKSRFLARKFKLSITGMKNSQNHRFSAQNSIHNSFQILNLSQCVIVLKLLCNCNLKSQNPSMFFWIELFSRLTFELNQILLPSIPYPHNELDKAYLLHSSSTHYQIQPRKDTWQCHKVWRPH